MNQKKKKKAGKPKYSRNSLKITGQIPGHRDV